MPFIHNTVLLYVRVFNRAVWWVRSLALHYADKKEVRRHDRAVRCNSFNGASLESQQVGQPKHTSRLALNLKRL
jgi:hypothetical protein